MFNYCRHFFNSSLQTGNLLTRQISKTKSTNRLNVFPNRAIHFWNKLLNKIKNSNSLKNFKVELDDFRNNGKKKNLGLVGRRCPQKNIDYELALTSLGVYIYLYIFIYTLYLCVHLYIQIYGLYIYINI